MRPNETVDISDLCTEDTIRLIQQLWDNARFLSIYDSHGPYVTRPTTPNAADIRRVIGDLDLKKNIRRSIEILNGKLMNLDLTDIHHVDPSLYDSGIAKKSKRFVDVLADIRATKSEN